MPFPPKRPPRPTLWKMSTVAWQGGVHVADAIKVATPLTKIGRASWILWVGQMHSQDPLRK